MNRSGNIGASKNMDSVFADFTEEDVFQDLMFDEDDQLIEIVEGYTEDGNTIFEEDEEIFKITHQIEDDSKTPEEVKKDTEDLLGPDNDSDQKISGIENVKDEKLDDSQTYDNLKKNGESEADKELGLEKLDDKYNSTADASVKEGYEYDKPDEAEGSDTKFGNKDLDNTAMPADDIKPTDDENYNATADASVKEEYDYDKPDEAEGTNDKFGNKDVDNSSPKPEDFAPNGDENYNSTNDASVKDEPFDESFIKWVHESEDGEKCDCGKDDCPICGKKSDLAPTATPIEDKENDERHEESSGETITGDNGEGIVPGNVDDNTLPKEDSTPEGSPEADNGDISDDSDNQSDKPVENTKEKKEDSCEGEECDEDKKLDEAFDKWLHEEDLEVPVLEPNETITPEDVEKAEDDLEKSAPETDNEIKTESENPKAEGTTDNMPEADATVPEDEACGKGSSLKEEFEAFLNEEDTTVTTPEDNSAMVSDNSNVGDINSDEDEATLEEAFNKWLHEEDEEIPTNSDVEAAAETEVEDTESELDDDLAAVADDDTEGSPEGLEYDPSDEDLIELAGGEEIDESVIFEKKNPEKVHLTKQIASIIRDEIYQEGVTGFNLQCGGFFTANFGTSSSKFFKDKSNEFYLTIKVGSNIGAALAGYDNTAGSKTVKEVVSTLNQIKPRVISAIKKDTGKDVEISIKALGNSGKSCIKVVVKNM